MWNATKVKAALAKKHGELEAKRQWCLRCQCKFFVKYRGSKRHPLPCGHTATCPQCICEHCLCWRELGRKKSGSIHLTGCPEYVPVKS